MLLYHRKHNLKKKNRDEVRDHGSIRMGVARSGYSNNLVISQTFLDCSFRCDLFKCNIPNACSRLTGKQAFLCHCHF